MKRIVFGCIIVLMLASCGGGDSKKDTSDSKNKSTEDITKNPDYQNGLALVAKFKCLTCHTVDEPFTGPPYREVANRYADRPDTIVPHLAKKIIEGGNGQWGEIFMLPNKGVQQEEAETMVRYILLLKK